MTGALTGTLTGTQLAARTRWRMAPTILLANLTGAVVVFVFLFYLLPIPGGTDPVAQRRINQVAFVAYLAVSGVVGYLWSERVSQPLNAWLRSELPASDEQRVAALRQPLRQTQVNAWLWIGAAAVFGALDAPYDRLAALDIALTILLGAFTTCTMGYLLAERLLRPVVTRAMVGSASPPAVVLGVKARLVLAWALGTATPLVGLALGVIAPGRGTPLGRPAVLFLVAVALGVGLLVIAAAAGAISDPVRSVAAGLHEVGHGRLDVTVPVYDASEVGRLQTGFNAMVQGLRERDRLRDLFGRQVGDDVAALALERGVELGGELREVAVLFVDVVGSTTLALSLDPQEVVRRLNAFFAVVIDVVQEHGGWVNKFEGDAALCIFGAPVELDSPPTCALSAARALAARLRPLEVEAAIGVAAGPVVAGHVGAESRFEYTVIGDPVNAAARLTDLAKTSAGCVLADAALLTLARPDEAAHWECGESVVLRGRQAPTWLAHLRAPG